MKNDHYPDFYEKISAPLRRTTFGVRMLNIINRILTLTMYILYPLMLMILLLCGLHNEENAAAAIRYTLPYVLIPGISFVLVTVVRDRLDWKRPYEEYELRPLIKKDTKGHSMPSRHVFSCTVIAMCLLSKSVLPGVVCLLFSVILCFVRVLGGVHYPRDVIAGFVIGILAGSLVFVFS